jgi:succinate dehydrogenase/fumarate reductase cytochrome b subunit
VALLPGPVFLGADPRLATSECFCFPAESFLARAVLPAPRQAVAQQSRVHVRIESGSFQRYKTGVNVTLVKALVLFVPAGLLIWHSLAQGNRRTSWSALQLLGATFFVIVVLTHICEALRLFPGMDWGAQDSPGHYLDLSSAVLGLTLFLAAYVIRFITWVTPDKNPRL